MKYLTICICGLLLLCSCGPTVNKIADETILADTSRISTIQPTDSILLLWHLDSLPKITFPFLSEFYNRNFSTVIDLHAFKDKRLFNLPFKRIEREAGGGSIDYEPEDSTFNLTDNDFQAQWNLIAKTPKFIVLEVYTGYAFFVTITYNLRVIDAIRSGYADPAGNVHWHADRHSIINKDLTILLQHYYEVQVDEKYNYDSETTEEKWLIDSNGHFKQK